MGKTEVKKVGFNLQEKVALVWFLLDAFTHLTIELGYVVLALTTTAERSDTYMGCTDVRIPDGLLGTQQSSVWK